MRIARVGDRLALVVLEAYLAELAVGYVLDEDPPHREDAVPLVLRPDVGLGVKVDARRHLSHAAELAAAYATMSAVAIPGAAGAHVRCIDAEE